MWSNIVPNMRPWTHVIWQYFIDLVSHDGETCSKMPLPALAGHTYCTSLSTMSWYLLNQPIVFNYVKVTNYNTIFKTMKIFVTFVFISLHILPCLSFTSFVFGDSLVDAGNNDYLFTLSKADSPPYGIDFKPSGGKPTGRFTNGRTISDIVGNATRLFFFFFLNYIFMKLIS